MKIFELHAKGLLNSSTKILLNPSCRGSDVSRMVVVIEVLMLRKRFEKGRNAS